MDRKERQPKRSNRGFTLAELLIVVAIIAVLVAVSIPIFINQLEKARRAVCLNERDTMRRAAAMATLTDDIDWTTYHDSAAVIAKLKDMGLIEEFECQSGGTIYADKNSIKAGNVSFRCTYHDDGKKPGDEEENLTGTGSALKNLQDALQDAWESYIKDNDKNNQKNNTAFLQNFFKNNNSEDYLKKEKVSDVLTEDQIEKLAKSMNEKQPGYTETQIRSVLQKYANSELTVAPYVLKDGTIVYYYTEDASRFGTDKTNHSNTSMMYYDGTWYMAPMGSANNLEIGFYPANFNSMLPSKFFEENRWIAVN
ncbi:MAG: prepilin-type N-terminal cleavage/methylation domain-containing protein [Lachnospiraceae bacterium]|nr:prepilin-type N-terminal cleavage/methylation domain-containing protein [Lachnospiraceae bacterium]